MDILVFLVSFLIIWFLIKFIGSWIRFDNIRKKPTSLLFICEDCNQIIPLYTDDGKENKAVRSAEPDPITGQYLYWHIECFYQCRK